MGRMAEICGGATAVTTNQSKPLKVAILTGADSASTRQSIESVCNIANVEVVGVLLDTYVPSRASRMKNLRRNVKREGLGYISRRSMSAFRSWLDAKAAKVVPTKEVDALLRAAFPERCFTLAELAQKYRFRIYEAGNLNSAGAAQKLRETGAALGIVLGTRILKRATFAVPPMGCINLHKGSVPDYRGMPPGFWELYDGAKSAGVTVHFVDDGLDTGDVIATGEFPVHPLETTDSVVAKLHREGSRVLAEAVASLQSGNAAPAPQPPCTAKPRTKPTFAERRQLASRAPHLKEPESDARNALKTIYALFMLNSGLLALIRKLRRAARGRGAIVLYHRVNDISNDNLTTSTRRFAEHMVLLQRYYKVVSSSWIAEKVRFGAVVDEGSVAIHFDDCYRDVYLEAGRLLKAAQLPATMFIATGFVDTERTFDHDLRKFPHRFENLHREDIPGLLDLGFEVGAHTVNHVDLGEIDLTAAMNEVVESKRQLELFSGREVTLFSFPFGKQLNIRDEVRQLVRGAGFLAMFSAHGGFVNGGSDPYAIPRLGTHSDYRGLDLMMELEGVSLSQLLAVVRRR